MGVRFSPSLPPSISLSSPLHFSPFCSSAHTHPISHAHHPIYGLISISISTPHRTWQLTFEPVLEPPVVLKAEREKLGMREDEFVVPALGETVFL